MRLTRVFSEQPLGADRELTLSASAAAHVGRVLRLGVGAQLTVFDGTGGEYPATIVESRGTVLRVRLGTHCRIERESPLKITLAQALVRGERMDWVIQKATELGVAVLVPLVTERSVVKLDAHQADKRREHWRGIAIAACEQCGRNRLPEILPPAPLGEFLSTARDGTRVLLDPAAEAGLQTIGTVLAVTLLIGPEGGLSPDERALAIDAGFTPVRMGPRVLRTETAAIAALSALQTLLGDSS
jgi:16S rRNA (uracil1498-N3)-methyltransferase